MRKAPSATMSRDSRQIAWTGWLRRYGAPIWRAGRMALARWPRPNGRRAARRLMTCQQENGDEVSARNQIKGKVIDVRKG